MRAELRVGFDSHSSRKAAGATRAFLLPRVQLPTCAGYMIVVLQEIIDRGTIGVKKGTDTHPPFLAAAG
jgi:hypothetical protein